MALTQTKNPVSIEKANKIPQFRYHNEQEKRKLKEEKKKNKFLWLKRYKRKDKRLLRVLMSLSFHLSPKDCPTGLKRGLSLWYSWEFLTKHPNLQISLWLWDSEPSEAFNWVKESFESILNYFLTNGFWVLGFGQEYSRSFVKIMGLYIQPQWMDL